VNLEDSYRIGLLFAGIGLLVVLVARLKVNPFVALLAVSLLVGSGAVALGHLGTGGPDAATSWGLPGVVKSMQEGLGATLGGVGAVLGLGAMLGKLLAESGGAAVLAERLQAWFGPSRAPWYVLVLALVIGLVTWFAVGLLLLLPIVLRLGSGEKRPFLAVAMPLVAGLSVMHALMPPHPGPVVAIAALHADTGLVLLFGAVVGIPTALVAGPLYARFLGPRLSVAWPCAPANPAPIGSNVRNPSLSMTLAAILLPIGLMLLATAAELTLPKGDQTRAIAVFVGDPKVALLVSVCFAMWVLGTQCGHPRARLLAFTERSVAEVGMTILIVGGGGSFAQVLKDGGMATALSGLAGEFHLSPLIYGWILAGFIRAATGSATVGITTAAGLMTPVLAQHPEFSRSQTALVVVAMGSGSAILSHLNDGGFWVVKETLGLTLRETFLTWGVCETLIGVVGLLLCLAFFPFV